MIKKILFFLLVCTSLIANDYNDGIKFYKAKDFENASKCFIKAANDGDLESAYILGFFYTGGTGVKMDLNEALNWYEKAASGGHINAQVNLGWAYIGGQGVKSDYEKGAYWIKKAKDAGSAQAKQLWLQFELEKYYKGK